MSQNTDQTGRLGIAAVQLTFERMGWIFREQPTSDFGIDAQAEKRSDSGEGTGKLIALQIKSGASYFRERGANVVYYGKRRHLDYWLNHSLPVFLVLHNPDTGVTLWQKVDPHLVTEHSADSWSIAMPKSQTLDTASEHFLANEVAADMGSIRRLRLVLDVPLIQQIADQEEVYLRVDDWVNKTLNYRQASFVFGPDPDGDAEMELGTPLAAYTLDYYMALFFPWLGWEVVDRVDEWDAGSGEVAEHVLHVRLNDIGKAMLTLTDFYSAPMPPFKPDPVEVINPLGSDEAWDYYESLHGADEPGVGDGELDGQ